MTRRDERREDRRKMEEEEEDGVGGRGEGGMERKSTLKRESEVAERKSSLSIVSTSLPNISRLL